MALPSTGSISMSQVNTELGLTATARISLNDAAVRTLAGRATGSISMSHLRGKSATRRIVITSDSQNQIYSPTIIGDQNVTEDLIIEIAAGVRVNHFWHPSHAYTRDRHTTLINNGQILGSGGSGGRGGGNNGSGGGDALRVAADLHVDNRGMIAGGGGGGGGGGSFTSGYPVGGGGGGGGQGAWNRAAAGGSGDGGALSGNAGSDGSYTGAGAGGASHGRGDGPGGAGGTWGNSGSAAVELLQTGSLVDQAVNQVAT